MSFDDWYHTDDEYRAELDDRAAEQVDRDWLLGQERVDHQQARAEQLTHDLTVLAARAAEDARLDLGRPGRLYRHDWADK